MDQFSIKDLFNIVVGWLNTGRNKPYPDPILLALREMEASAKEAVFIGDTKSDIIAAQRAGIFSVLVSWSEINTSDDIKPNIVIHHIKDILNI